MARKQKGEEMTLDKKIELSFGDKIDVTKLSYNEMMYYSKHNVYLKIETIFCFAIKRIRNNKNK